MCAHYNRWSHSFITVPNLRTNLYAYFLSPPLGHPKTFSLPLSSDSKNFLRGGVWIFSGTTQLDGTGYNTYGTSYQYPEVRYWILRGDTNLWILVSQLDTEKKYKFQTLVQSLGHKFSLFIKFLHLLKDSDTEYFAIFQGKYRKKNKLIPPIPYRKSQCPPLLEYRPKIFENQNAGLFSLLLSNFD